jgi:hypothetical protein
MWAFDGRGCRAFTYPSSMRSFLFASLLVACSSEQQPVEPGDSAPADVASDSMLVDSATEDTAPIDVGTIIEPGDPGAADVTFEIRSDKDQRPISPLIYGINGSKNNAVNKPTLLRSGGNRMTAYNWENNASNAGSDYCFQNDGLISASDVPGEAIKKFVEEARAASAAALVTVPIVDYVAADKTGGSAPPGCSGDVRKTGTTYLSTRFRKNVAKKIGATSYPPNTSDDSVYQNEFVSWIRNVATTTPVYFSLDNEPDLWSSTHAEVHPMAVGYDELIKRNLDFAAAIKSAWPDAKVTGFVSYGWQGYTSLQDAPDRAGKGEFTEYYLKKLKEADTGTRLVDYLDLHWYPETYGGGVRVTEPAANDAVVAARVQSPRALWDSTYVDPSWISDAIGKAPIRLIPRMKEKIAANYPGTKLAFTEWHFGGGAHISGALATADVLGIFGREGVDLANIWWLNPDDKYTEAGLQAFRNYDGAGAAFGSRSISATTSKVETATVYASLDPVVIIAINKQAAEKSAAIKIAHSVSYKAAKVWTVTSASAKPVAAAAITAVATNAFNYKMPAWSISIIQPQPGA